MSEKNNNEQRYQKKVVIKKEHLSPMVQSLIGFFHYARFVRVFTEVAAGGFALQGKGQLAASAIAATSFLALRAVAARNIQEYHHVFVEAMNQYGILDTKFEGHYPRDWIKPGAVMVTHPIFYVTRRGDLVFLRENRSEYYRHEFQRSTLGKIGLNAWRWRAYLRPPKAPEKAKEWAKRKLGEQIRKWRPAIERMRRTPVPVPALKPIRPYHMEKRRISRKK